MTGMLPVHPIRLIESALLGGRRGFDPNQLPAIPSVQSAQSTELKIDQTVPGLSSYGEDMHRFPKT